MTADMSRNVRKRTFWLIRPEKIQISLRIRVDWLESSVGEFWIDKDTEFLHMDNKYYCRTARMRRLIWVFVWRTCEKARFLTLRLI